MRRFATALLALSVCWAFPASAAQAEAAPAPQQEVKSLEELLVTVRDRQRRLAQRNREREEAFLAAKQEQSALLAEAKRDFQRRQRENEPLLVETEHNAAQIANLEEQLAAVVQDMGDLSATFREFAGDFSAVFDHSLLSAQFPARRQATAAMAANSGPATIAEIESLWLLLQEDMTEAARIGNFPGSVVSAEGLQEQASILRIGPFSAYRGGDFLRYVPETGELLILTRQPQGKARSSVKSFTDSRGEPALMAIDPTRGGLLGVMSYSPDVKERVQQGGVIGVIIIGLGMFGLVIACWRGVYLLLVSLQVRRQLRAPDAATDANPLGRVLLAARHNNAQEEEVLKLKLDEAILTELPALERGNGVIKLLAATSPLLGLLGTVTGMIITFQTISLFGTGDPRLMAGGISQALVTTVLGLVVAIPLLFSHSLINYLCRSIIQCLDEQSAGVLARMIEQRERQS